MAIVVYKKHCNIEGNQKKDSSLEYLKEGIRDDGGKNQNES
jgi:hypothetical protein